MNRTLGLERIYLIEPYQTLKVIDSFVDVPEEHVLNSRLIGKIRLLQIAEIETEYQKYLQIKEELDLLTQEEALKLLEAQRETITNSIKELLSGEK